MLCKNPTATSSADETELHTVQQLYLPDMKN